jgi:hypothetical protein
MIYRPFYFSFTECWSNSESYSRAWTLRKIVYDSEFTARVGFRAWSQNYATSYQWIKSI